MGAQVRGIGNLDDLEQGILDDGISQAGGNVSHRGPFLLGLFYIGVHEYGAAGAKVRWVPGKQGLFGKILHGKVQALGKCLDEGAAARGARLVELHAVHGAVLYLDALHVLSPDVQDTVHIRLKESSRVVVGDGLHFPLIQHQRCL